MPSSLLNQYTAELDTILPELTDLSEKQAAIPGPPGPTVIPLSLHYGTGPLVPLKLRMILNFAFFPVLQERTHPEDTSPT